MSTVLAHARETAPIKRRIVSAVNGALRAVRLVLPEPRKVCVIPPSGAGSLGDQAMMEVVRRVLSARFGLEASFLYEPRESQPRSGRIAATSSLIVEGALRTDGDSSTGIQSRRLSRDRYA